MADKKFKLSEKQANGLIWDEVMGEDETNFTDEFRASVFKVIRKIREAI